MGKIHHVGRCPLCQGYGSLEICKNINDNKLLVVCEECMAEWNSPEEVFDGIKGKRRSLETGMVISAEIEEIKECGWDKYLVNE